MSLARCGSFIGLIGSTIVRVVYSDESGCGSIKKEPVTVVAAIVLNLDRQWDSVSALMTAAKMATPRNLLHERTLKGSHLYSALRKNITGAKETLERVLQIIVFEKVPIFYGAVDRAGCLHTDSNTKLKSPLEEYTFAFRHCLSAVDSAASAFASGEKVLWIAEESDAQRELASRGGHETIRLLKPIEFRDGRFVHTNESTSIIDTIYFGKKQYSIILQLADICCSTITLHLLETFYGWKRTRVRPFFDLIRPHILGGSEKPDFFGFEKVQRWSSHGL
jgi:hypothetical protein